MSKASKEVMPAQIDLWTRNMHEFYSDIERLVLDGYEIVKDGYQSPTMIAGILSATLILKE